MTENNILINQDVKVLIQQIIARFNKGDAPPIIIAPIGSVNLDGGEVKFDLLEWIESLPQPRLENAITAIIVTAKEHCVTGEKTAMFLGTTRRAVEYNFTKKGEKHEALFDSLCSDRNVATEPGASPTVPCTTNKGNLRPITSRRQR